MGNVQQALIYLSMTDTISYQYAAPSVLQRSSDQDELFLAKYSEIEKKEAPCFFWGKLTQPYMTARCLIALSNVVQSSFNLTPAQLSMLKDPIVTAGNERLRFEGFSNCAAYMPESMYCPTDTTESSWRTEQRMLTSMPV